MADAILEAGYRHLDSASIYGNERSLGRALALALATTAAPSNGSKRIERSRLFVASKVWNDAQRGGRDAVRKSVLQSLRDLGLDYLDLCYVHWPVPGHFVETYRELMDLRREGKILHLGISNFRIEDYEELEAAILPPEEFVPPLVHQLEVSPFLYRPETLRYFKEKGVLVAASKALHRAATLDDPVVEAVAESHSHHRGGAGVTPPQVLLRWGLQKGLVVLAKTSRLSRMVENRDLLDFELSLAEVERLDALTTPGAIETREALEAQRREG